MKQGSHAQVLLPRKWQVSPQANSHIFLFLAVIQYILHDIPHDMDLLSPDCLQGIDMNRQAKRLSFSAGLPATTNPLQNPARMVQDVFVQPDAKGWDRPWKQRPSNRCCCRRFRRVSIISKGGIDPKSTIKDSLLSLMHRSSILQTKELVTKFKDLLPKST